MFEDQRVVVGKIWKIFGLTPVSNPNAPCRKLIDRLVRRECDKREGSHTGHTVSSQVQNNGWATDSGDTMAPDSSTLGGTVSVRFRVDDFESRCTLEFSWDLVEKEGRENPKSVGPPLILKKRVKYYSIPS